MKNAEYKQAKTPAGQKPEVGQGSGVTPAQAKPIVIRYDFDEEKQKGWVFVLNSYPIKDELKVAGFKFHNDYDPAYKGWEKDLNSHEEVVVTVKQVYSIAKQKGIQVQFVHSRNLTLARLMYAWLANEGLIQG